MLGKAFPTVFLRFKNITHTAFTFNNTNGENHFDSGYNKNEWSSSSTRLALWQCGKEVWHQHPVLGTGLGDIRNELKAKYTEKQFWFALNTNRNLHCQYLDVLVSMGIAGLLIFLTVFIIYPVKTFVTHGQTLAMIVFAGFAFCLLTENMLDRFQGEELVALMLPVVIKVFDKK